MYRLGLSLLVGGASCSLLILIHAFKRSVGTGCMVLGIPFYILYYAFSQFDHPRRNWIVAGWLGSVVPGLVILH